MKTLYLLFLSFLLLPACIQAQGTITSIAGYGNVCATGLDGDGGPALNACIEWPYDVCLDDSGNIYYADFGKYKIRKIDAMTGIINTVAGNDTVGYFGDNGPAIHAKLSSPKAVAVDHEGNIYIADASNYRIRKVDHITGIITTVAGTGISGYNGDNIRADTAQITLVLSISIDDSDNVYFTDSYNNSVRKITVATGMISRVVGNGTNGFELENVDALQTPMWSITGVHIDKHHNLFITDAVRQQVYKVTAATGIFNRIAGIGTQGYSGDNHPALQCEFYQPWGIHTDTFGNIFIADRSNQVIRKINTSGIITTIAGNGTAGFFGDGGPALNAEFEVPTGITVTQNGNTVFIADLANDKLRKVSFNVGIHDISIESTCSISPNPTKGQCTIHTPSQNPYQLDIYNTIGQKLYTRIIYQQDTPLDLSYLTPGTYFAHLYSGTFTTMQQLIIYE